MRDDNRRKAESRILLDEKASTNPYLSGPVPPSFTLEGPTIIGDSSKRRKSQPRRHASPPAAGTSQGTNARTDFSVLRGVVERLIERDVVAASDLEATDIDGLGTKVRTSGSGFWKHPVTLHDV
jgi:hypothetical protein